MKWLQAVFSTLQKIGKAMMLPVAVLPIAGLLLCIGTAKFGIFPELVSGVMGQAGAAIFSNLPIIFAIGTALGLCKNDGVAALAAVVGYVVLVSVLGVLAQAQGAPTQTVMGVTSLDTGVFGGIWMGIVAAVLFNRYYDLKLPTYLGFFSGKRSVPILTAFAAIVSAGILSLLWPPIGQGIQGFSHWAAAENPRAAFTLYGFVERLLIPFGLHHIWNVPFFFQSGQYVDPVSGKVFVGEIARYVAGDPTAGNLAGGYLFKMWGLPAAALAIWHAARPENRKLIGGLMISAALTSFLTGITEPIEFAFMFVAPLLYFAHAVACAAAYFVCITLQIKHGMTFSHGLLDFLLLFPQSQHGLWFLWLGPLWGAGYYFGFSYLIRVFQLTTPGREATTEKPEAEQAEGRDRAQSVLNALGGAANIKNLDSCITRLRVQVNAPQKVQSDALKRLGAVGVVTVADGIQAIFGTESENLRNAIDALLGTGAQPTPPSQVALASEKAPNFPESWWTYLGGKDNVVDLKALNSTRFQAQLVDPERCKEVISQDQKTPTIIKYPNKITHIIVRPG